MDCGYEWSSDEREDRSDILGGFEWYSYSTMDGAASPDSSPSENDASEQSWHTLLDETSDTNSWADSETRSVELDVMAGCYDGCDVSSDPGLVVLPPATQDPLPPLCSSGPVAAAAGPLMQDPGSALASPHGSTWQGRQDRSSCEYLLPARVGALGQPLLAKESVPPACPVDNQDGSTCPLCARPCKEPHRLGKYWRKFGYKGPPYCSRCSNIFRAHVLTCTVQPETCHRERPCGICAAVMTHFDRPKKELFAEMDAAQPRSRGTTTKPGSDAGQLQPPCPVCKKTTHNGLGVFWKKFGYQGPPYCNSCSSRFRNHIIRGRNTRSQCSRQVPCETCLTILRYFPGNLETVYSAVDSHDLEMKMDATVAQHRVQSKVLNSFPCSEPTKTRRKRAAISAHAPAVYGNGEAPKRQRKIVSGLIAALSLMTIVAGLVDWPMGISVKSSTSQDDTGFLLPKVCRGGQLQPNMNEHDLEQCVGQPGDVCTVGCDDGYSLIGEMVCADGQFRGARCVMGQSAGGKSLAVCSSVELSGPAAAPMNSHFDPSTLAACFGPVGSRCVFQCRTGYVPFGTMTCEPKNDGSGLAGKFSGGVCRPDPAMIDALIATMLINEDLPSLPNRTFVIAPSVQESIIRQSWVSQLQLARGNSALLSGLLHEHVPLTHIQWAKAAGFVQSSYAQQQNEDEMEYGDRLVQLLIEPLARGGYNDATGNYGVLSPTDPLSAAYEHYHSCPANTYGRRNQGRVWRCLPCPGGTEAPPGSIAVSDCTRKDAVTMCASQHADCTDGCLLVPRDYWTECAHACEQRCSNCVRTADNATAQVATQCGSTGTDARLPVEQGLVSFLQLAPPPPPPPPPPPRLSVHHSGAPQCRGCGAEDWWTQCLTAGDCENVEIDAAAPVMSVLITVLHPEGTRVWQFFSPAIDPHHAGQ